MVGNTGTYLDSPFHRFPHGHDLAGIPLAAVADLPAVVVDARGRRAVDVQVLTDQLGSGAAVDGAAVLLRPEATAPTAPPSTSRTPRT